eukprot:gene31038-37513_t
MDNDSGTVMLQMGAVVGLELANTGQPLFGGSQLQGKVFLQVVQEKVSANSLVLTFLGAEKTCIRYFETVYVEDGPNGTRTCYTYASSPVVNIQATLAQFPAGHVAQGGYEFPFVLTLPPNIPGSQGQTVGPNYFAIQYGLTVELLRPASMTNAKVHNGVEVIIMDPPATGPPAPSRVPPQVIPLVFCGCMDTGTMQLTAIADNTRLAMGESFNVDFGVQNMSSSKVQGVEVTLFEVVKARAPPGHSFHSQSQLFHRSIPALEVPGTQTQRKGQIYQSVPGQADSSMLKKLLVSVPVCRPTYTGNFGSVSHVLVVRAVMSACTTVPLIEVNVRIYGSRLVLGAQSLVMAGPMGATVLLGMSAPAGSEGGAASGGGGAVNFGGNTPPAGDGSVDVHSVQYLIQQLQSSNQFLEVSIVRYWLSQGGRVDDLTPDRLQKVFGCIRQDASFASLADDIGAALLGRLTLDHVAAAARGAPESQRSSLCIAFSQYVHDKSSARSVLSDAGLSQSELDLVLLYFSVLEV